MLSGVTANQGKNNRMMIFDDFKFFRHEGRDIAKNLKIMGCFGGGWLRVDNALRLISENVKYRRIRYI